MNIRKTADKASMKGMLVEGEIRLPPLEITTERQEFVQGKDRTFDAFITAQLNGRRWRFAVLTKALSTPLALRTAMSQIKSAILPPGTLPMVILPYLSASHLHELEQAALSGLDLCGNGIVLVPDELFVFRTGQPNRYPNSAPIKNIYRNNSSMVSRVFLTRPRFGKVSEVLMEVNSRNWLAESFGRPSMVMGTASKAIKALEEDLIVSREQDILRLVQPEKLLEKLLENYRPGKLANVLRRRINLAGIELQTRIAELSRDLSIPVVATGLGSATRYAVMQRGDLLSVYCPSPEVLIARLPVAESDRFPNLEIVPSGDESVFFDCRTDDQTGLRWASPVQSWLEMMRGDKRDQEMAEQIRSEILRRIRDDK